MTPELAPHPAFPTISHLEDALRSSNYLPDHGLATAIFLALGMGKPLLLEGEAGVGKTQVAKTLASLLGSELIRLQCYEGIDAAQAIYEWDYSRQLLHARAMQDVPSDPRSTAAELYGPDFLVERPLLRAIRSGSLAVLLIDELDRADDEFEAFLLEILSEYSVTIPEMKTITAESVPIVIITSNRTRELHDALKRRCIYHWIELPTIEREIDILRLHVPGASERLVRSVALAVSRLRELDLVKHPGVAEAIDWCAALSLVGSTELDAELAQSTIGSVVKNREDIERARAALAAVPHDSGAP